MDRAQNNLAEDVMICNYKGCTKKKVKGILILIYLN